MSEASGKQTGTASRGMFSGNIGFILAVAGSAVGLGNIWRFPYYAAKYGGGIFLLVYLVLLLTFAFGLIAAETALGRKTRLSPIGAYTSCATDREHRFLTFSGFINAIVPMIILPYYCLIGGWILKFLFQCCMGKASALAADGYFGGFIGAPLEPILWHVIFLVATVVIILKGVKAGIEKASRVMMPMLLILALGVAVFSVTRPGALEGVKYFLVPDFSKFSIMTVVAACGQLFFSLSIGMGILITYGSYMRKEVDIEKASINVGIIDTIVAVLAGFMVIPAVFAFSGGDPNALKAGAGLVFITLPKVFNSMDFGSFIGAAFFLMVFFAALTSNISILEACVSTLCDEFRWSRQKATYAMAFEALALGVPCSLGFGPWESIQIAGMSILDMMDFVAGSMLTPFAALLTCLLIGRFIGVKAIIEEIRRSSQFKLEGLFRVSIVWIAPPLLLLVFVSSVLAALGIIKI